MTKKNRKNKKMYIVNNRQSAMRQKSDIIGKFERF